MNKKNLLSLILGAALLVGIAGYSLTSKDSVRPPAAEAPAIEQQAAQETTPEAPAETPAAAAEETPAPAGDAVKSTPASQLTYDSASLPSEPLGERTLGNPDAPVRIEEFYPTCPHCAHFHRDSFAALKEKYIDTGKVFFVFTDFPLNAPALDAAMIARCLPPAQFFTFIAFLYETQDTWAFSPEYKNILRQNAKLAGMTDEGFDSCLANTALKEGIAKRIEEKGTLHKISSTPSFVINGTVMSGALKIDQLDKAITDAQAAPPQ